MESLNASSIEARRKIVKETVARAQALDLCFLLNATTSMQGSMDMVKRRVTTMASGIKVVYSDCELRVAVVLYHDYDDHDIDGNEGCDFTTNFIGSQSTFVKSLSSVRASEREGFFAEDVFTGLERVAKLDWRAASRLLVHICDAPCHGTRFNHHGLSFDHGGLPFSQKKGTPAGFINCDKYPHGDKYGRDITSLLQELRIQVQITRYFFCHISFSTTKMIREFKKVIMNMETNWIRAAFFNDIPSIPYKVIPISRRIIKRTIGTSMARLNTDAHGPGRNGFVPETVVKSKPDWERIRKVEGQLYQLKWYSSLEELLTIIKNKQTIEVEETNSLVVKIAPNPFSDEGIMRRPYHALVPQLGSKCMVVKRFKMPLGEDTRSIHSKERYLGQMEAQAVAAQMAHEFNERTRPLGDPHCGEVNFTTVSTLYAGFKNYNMEEYLEHACTIYSNNAGYLHPDIYTADLEAFTHWTYERSKGELMVTGLQGVTRSTPDRRSYKFWLYDPTVHCKDLMRFAGTNLGEDGSRLFFLTHKCSNLCRLLRLRSRTHSSVAGDVSRFPATSIEIKDRAPESPFGKKRKASEPLTLHVLEYEPFILNIPEDDSDYFSEDFDL